MGSQPRLRRPNFAHVALFTVGIYTHGLIGLTLGLSPWFGILMGGVAAALIAALITLPILRLSGIYIVLVTIAASQVLYQIVISQSNITGGTSGMVSLPMLELFGYRFNHNGKIGYYYVALLILVASTTILHAVKWSRYGRAIVAMRDHKFYAVSRGMSETRIRLFTLVVSAALAGIAGWASTALICASPRPTISASVFLAFCSACCFLGAPARSGGRSWPPFL